MSNKRISSLLSNVKNTMTQNRNERLSSNILDNSGLWKSKDGSSRQQDLDSQSIGQKCGKDEVESVGSRNRKNSLSKIFGNTNSGQVSLKKEQVVDKEEPKVGSKIQSDFSFENTPPQVIQDDSNGITVVDSDLQAEWSNDRKLIELCKHQANVGDQIQAIFKQDDKVLGHE